MVTFSALRNIAWLQGGGYDIVHVEVPVHFKGEKDDFKAFFEPVLWEDVPDAILTGREQLGYSKLFGFIKTMDELDGISRGSIATHDFTFLDMQVRVEEEPENLDTLKKVLANPEIEGKVHFKYMPHTEAPFLTADACYSVWGTKGYLAPEDIDNSDCPPTESVFCRGKVFWHRPEWKDAPAQARILQYLYDLGCVKYVGAQKLTVYSPRGRVRPACGGMTGGNIRRYGYGKMETRRNIRDRDPGGLRGLSVPATMDVKITGTMYWITRPDVYVWIWLAILAVLAVAMIIKAVIKRTRRNARPSGAARVLSRWRPWCCICC